MYLLIVFINSFPSTAAS